MVEAKCANWDHAAVRRVLRILSTALITAGLVILLDVAVTLAWREPVSTIYGSIQQGRATDALDELRDEFPSAADLRAADRVDGVRRRAGVLADRFADQVAERAGEGIGRVRLPGIGLDSVLVEGTDTDTLRTGPGRYPDTAVPGQGRTVGIAGHRTTYLAPFRNIDDLEDGDEVIVEMPYATFTYEIERIDIVEPTDVQIVKDAGYERVVLTACHPLYSAAQRYAVFGRLEGVSLFAGLDRRWLDP
jgi:sortase A